MQPLPHKFKVYIICIFAFGYMLYWSGFIQVKIKHIGNIYKIRIELNGLLNEQSEWNLQKVRFIMVMFSCFINFYMNEKPIF